MSKRDLDAFFALLMRMCASNRWVAGTRSSTAGEALPEGARVAIIETPEGQLCWPYEQEQQDLFEAMPVYEGVPDLRYMTENDVQFERLQTIIRTIDRITAQLRGLDH